jgi:hypothetical protein
MVWGKEDECVHDFVDFQFRAWYTLGQDVVVKQVTNRIFKGMIHIST